MSYILNALKQSENQRNLGEIPHIDTTQEPTSPYRPAQRRAAWRNWPLLAGLLLPLLAIGWLLLSDSATPPAAQKPAPTSGEVALALPVPAEPVPAPAGTQAPGLAQLQNMAGARIQLDDQPPPTPARILAPVVLELPLNSGRVAREPVTARPDPAQSAPVAIPQRGAGVEAQEPGADAQLSGVDHWKGLPSGIQQQLRELGINAHVYSTDSSARFIRAKGRSLREGDQLSDELLLQQITRDGIIFTYQTGKYWMRLN